MRKMLLHLMIVAKVLFTLSEANSQVVTGSEKDLVEIPTSLSNLF